jgi:hypothetical protein
MIGVGLFALVKIAVSVLFVVVLSIIAERAGPRVAGVISGYPMGAAITLFFIGVEIGPGFASRSAVFTAAGLSATVAFVAGYLAGLGWARNRGRAAAIGISVSTALAAYGGASWLLTRLSIGAGGAALIAAASIALATWGFRAIADVPIIDRNRLRFRVTLIRAAFAALVILTITTIAKVVGTRWAGLFSAFPSTVLPLLVIIQFTYHPDHVRTIIKNVPRGLQSLLVYVLIVAATYDTIGVAWGTVLGYAAATVYLLALEYSRRLKWPARSKG